MTCTCTIYVILILAFPHAVVIAQDARQELFDGVTGKVHFTSDAPLEVIQAQSDSLAGVVNIKTNAVAFTIEPQTFHGFNSSLQRSHFLENYLEADLFPVITFKGKILDSIDLHAEGSYPVRVKGEFNIHGVARERIVRGIITRRSNTFRIQSRFNVPLEDYNIKVPKLMQQKIAEVIFVEVDISLNNED